VKELKVIHPIYNKKGIGIIDGTKEQMRQAIDNSISRGKGIYLMKALGGGHLIKDSLDSLNHARSIDGIASIAVGMKSTQEIDYNVSVFKGIVPNKEVTEKISNTERHLHIHDWCVGCGKCIEACQHGALQIKNNKVEVDKEKCILCGYCATRCKDFCIKVI
jgi:ferredoxin